MSLQYITDYTGAHTAVVIPINEWEEITHKHEDLKKMEEAFVPPTSKPAIKLSDYAGELSNETADVMLSYVAESREEWEERTNKQL